MSESRTSYQKLGQYIENWFHGTSRQFICIKSYDGSQFPQLLSRSKDLNLTHHRVRKLLNFLVHLLAFISILIFQMAILFLHILYFIFSFSLLLIFLYNRFCSFLPYQRCPLSFHKYFVIRLKSDQINIVCAISRKFVPF